MSTDRNEVTTTKERVIKASKTCPDAKGVLKELFPEVFKEEWKDITTHIEWEWTDCVLKEKKGAFLRGNFSGRKVVYWNGWKKGHTTGGFALLPAEGLEETVKIEKFNDLIKVFLKS